MLETLSDGSASARYAPDRPAPEAGRARPIVAGLIGLLNHPSTLFLTLATVLASLSALGAMTFAPGAELALVAGAIVVAGLPHGAADGWIATRSIARDRLRALAFLAGYVCLALLVVGAWRLLPFAGLVTFLIVSAWHFGDDARLGLRPVVRLSTGTIILSAPAVFSPAEVAQAYRILSGAGAEAIVAVQAGLFWPACVIAVAAAVVHRSAKRDTRHWIDLGLLVALSMVASPLIYFAVYFSGIHSMRHLNRIVRAEPGPRSRSFWWGLIILTLVAALAGLTAFVWLAGAGRSLDAAGLQVLFVGLAALTLPHMLLVDGLLPWFGGAARSDRPSAPE